MGPIEPRPLYSGWPLHEVGRHFELGSIIEIGPGELAHFAVRQALGRNRAGWWECDLSDNSLTWTAGVYEIFGLPEGAPVTRQEAVALYSEPSRSAMERLRNYSIANRAAFVIDAKIRPASGEPERWMRLIGAPVWENGRVAKLEGLKLRI